MKNKKTELEDIELGIDFTHFEDLHRQQFDLENRSLESDIEARHNTNRIAALQLAVQISNPDSVMGGINADDVLETANKFLNFINGK